VKKRRQTIQDLAVRRRTQAQAPTKTRVVLALIVGQAVAPTTKGLAQIKRDQALRLAV